MSENKEQRLSKVAKELNVSIGTITEFLKGKGHAVDNNPMAKITEEHYSLLAKEYQSEKAAKEDAQKVTSSTRAKKESITLEDAKKPESKREEEEDIIIKNIPNPITNKEKVVEKPAKKVEEEEVKEVIKSDVKITVVSKIDLDSINNPAFNFV